MTYTLEPFLTVEDLMVLFVVSRVTVYRWNRLAKEGGRSRIPCAIDGDEKQGLRWRRDAVLAHLSASSPKLTPKVESAATRTKRHNTAVKSLKAKGVKINDPEK